MKYYKEVKCSEELPDETGKAYSVRTENGGWNVAYRYGGKAEDDFWKQTFDYWLKPRDIDISEVVSEVEDMRPYKEAGNPDSYSSYNEGWADACDILGQKITEYLTKLNG